MLPELRYELLLFYTRDQLEHLQPLSQSLLDMIVAGSNVLSLRPIDAVYMDCKGVGVDNIDKIEIIIDREAANGWQPDYEASIHDGDFKETVLRLQHTCIKSFYVRIRDNPFLRYWMAQETAAFTVVKINFELRKRWGYARLDSIMNYLRPRTMELVVDESSWHVNGYNVKKLKLLARDSFLNNLQLCRLSVWKDAFPPSSFILNEPGYPSYELFCSHPNVAEAIDGLIESFVHNGCSNMKLESVCVRWDDGGRRPSPMPKQLSKPTKTEMTLPKNNVTDWVVPDVDRVSQCEMHSFIDKKHWKRMEVHKWTVIRAPLRSQYGSHPYVPREEPLN